MHSCKLPSLLLSCTGYNFLLTHDVNRSISEHGNAVQYREVNKNNDLDGQFQIFLPKN